jgi:16S rRNA (guanine527-N7)-methyltransferase
MAEKLFLDVLPVCAQVPSACRLLDLGSGGGFPGIPLKVVRSDIEVTLLDGKRKKVSFLKQVIRILGLKGVEARQGRAEELIPRTRAGKGVFDVVISKAVAELDSLLRLSLPLVNRGGMVIAMKGAAVGDEIGLARSTIDKEGLEIKMIAYELPFSGITRNLVVLKKKGGGSNG